MGQTKPITSLEFLGVLGEYNAAKLTEREAFNKFRSEYEMSILEGRTADERQQKFNILLDHYRKYPAQLVFDMRQEKTSLLKKDLAEAFLSCETVTELECEEWFGELAKVKNYDRAIIEAIETLADKEPGKAEDLLNRAKILWPTFWAAPSDD